MSDRQRLIRSTGVARPELVAASLRRIATVLDIADDGRKATFISAHPTAASTSEMVFAWSAAALLIADECDVTTAKLKSIANRIDKGVQGELDT